MGEELAVNGTLAAGCSCVTGLAKVTMHRTPVTLARACPLVRYRNAVDDVMMQAVGKMEAMKEQMPNALVRAINGFEALDLVAS